MKVGFTLIEVLISISILLFAVFLPFAIISDYLLNNELTRNQLQAQLRAQEIIELVRLDRDSTIVNPKNPVVNWFAKLSKGEGNFGSCAIKSDPWNNGDGTRKDCQVKCLPDITVGSTDSSDLNNCRVTEDKSFVWAVGPTRRQPTTTLTETCDGEDPYSNGEFTVTLNIVIANRLEKDTQYAIISPCVSWERDTGEIRKVELKETLFEWVTL